MRRFLIVLTCVLAIGAVATGVAYRQLEKLRTERDQAAQTAVKEDIKVTIIEGKRREEIAAKVAAAGICTYGDFMFASKDYEGVLFPDTYRFYANTPATTVVATMNQDYQKRTKDMGVTRDQLILASIVEREALNDADRPVIAGIYQNRLEAGMFLGSDPTVQYGKDSLAYAASVAPESYSFWKPITQADYQSVQSPYNTYIHLGLPAGPIANPGLKSIEAAQNPAQTDALYFLYKNGRLVTSKTLEEHEAQAE